MRKALTILTATTLVVVATGIAMASIPAANDVIHGCYDTKHGDLRVVDMEAGQTCDPNETLLSWNQTGPQGPAGPQGPQGPPGQPGGEAFSVEADGSVTLPDHDRRDRHLAARRPGRKVRRLRQCCRVQPGLNGDDPRALLPRKSQRIQSAVRSSDRPVQVHVSGPTVGRERHHHRVDVHHRANCSRDADLALPIEHGSRWIDGSGRVATDHGDFGRHSDGAGSGSLISEPNPEQDDRRR